MTSALFTQKLKPKMGDLPNFTLHFDIFEKSESERDQLVEESQAKSTRSTTKWVVSLFKDFDED